MRRKLIWLALLTSDGTGRLQMCWVSISARQLKLQWPAAAFQFHCARLATKVDHTTHGGATWSIPRCKATKRDKQVLSIISMWDLGVVFDVSGCMLHTGAVHILQRNFVQTSYPKSLCSRNPEASKADGQGRPKSAPPKAMFLGRSWDDSHDSLLKFA